MWKLVLLDWDGDAIGEFTDANNIRLNFGLSKSSNLTFETNLETPMGKEIADRDFSVIAAYKQRESDGDWRLKFVGPVLSTEEIADNNIPTIAVTAVDAYWRLSKRIVNNNLNEGRGERGVPASPTLDGYILACDTGNHRILKFNEPDATLDKTIGSLGSGNGQFNTPQGVAVDKLTNNYYVADTNNYRIQKFDANDNYVTKWGSNGTGAGQFGADMRGIAVDKDGNVWVGDRVNQRLQKFDPYGNVLLVINGNSNHPLDFIYDVIAYEDKILACDLGGTLSPLNYYGVQVFSVEGNYLGRLSEGLLPNYSVAPAQTSDALDYNKSGPLGNLKKAYAHYSSFFGTDLSVGQIDNNNDLISIGLYALFGSANGTLKVLNQLPYQDYIYLAVSESGVSSSIKVFKSDILARDILTPATPVKTYSSFGTGTGQSKDLKYFDFTFPKSKTGIQVARDAITNTNTIDGNSWVKNPSIYGSSPYVVIDYGTWGGFKKISDIIEELAGNFEWKMVPIIENAGTSNVKFGTFETAEIMGTNKSSTVNFEYGTNRLNAKNYTIRKTIESLANKASYPAAGYVPYDISSTDSTSVSSVGLFEEVLSGSVVVPELRAELTQLSITLRKNPRILVEIQPIRSDQSDAIGGSVPIPLEDYEPGDIIGIKIIDNNNERIDGEARLYDIEINVDNNGKEEATLKLYIE